MGRASAGDRWRFFINKSLETYDIMKTKVRFSEVPMAEKLKVEYVDIGTLKPYAGNAKRHPEEQVEQIKRSIQEFGFNDPLAVWHDEIVEGHGRHPLSHI